MGQRLVAVIAALGVAVAGCSGSASPDTAPTSTTTLPPLTTGLATALSWVKVADAGMVVQVEYGDSAAVRKLMAQNPRFVSQDGYGALGNSAALVDLIGVNPKEAQQSLKVRVGLERIGVLRMDVDVAAVNAKFEALGATKGDSQGGVTSWLTDEDGAGPRSPLAGKEFGGLLNQVRVGSESIGYTTSKTVLRTESATPLDNPALAELARCLGDVTTAVVSRTAGDLVAGAGVRVVDGKPSEVLCALHDKAGDHVDRVRERLATPMWTPIFPGATAEVPAEQPGVVRVVAPDDGELKIGRTAEMILDGKGKLSPLMS